MSKEIIVKLSIEGIHYFEGAPVLFPEVAFLSHPHRHTFNVVAGVGVTHSDRDKEFIMLKRDILDYLKEKFYDAEQRTHFFGPLSCESIAENILQKFKLDWVEVWEDDENGAKIAK